MLPSDMNLRIGSFKIGTNVKINLDVKCKQVEMVKTEPDVKQKKEPNIEPNKKHKQDVKPNIKFDRESKQDVKKPDTNKITYEKEKVALVLGMTTIFTAWWMFE